MLGCGGTGLVFLARDTQTDQVVALKLIDTSDADAEEIIKAENRGAVLQARLCGLDLDSRIVKVYDYGEADGHFYVAMEYVEGQDLAGPLAPDDAARIAVDVCEVLEVAHNFRDDENAKEGIVHGDIKPRNIRITKRGRVKVLDFGAAKSLSHTRKYTQHEAVTIAYSSPERLDTGTMDKQTDLWSVGISLYEIVFGYLPYQDPDAHQLEKLICQRKPPRFPATPACPDALKSIILKLLAPNIGARYPSAATVKEDLIRFRQGKRTIAEQDADTEATTRPYQKQAGVGVAREDDEPESERTRRTRKPQAAEAASNDPIRYVEEPSPPIPTPRPDPPAPKPTPGQLFRRVRRILPALLALIIVLVFANEARVYMAAARLKDDLSSEREKDLNQAWERYRSLKSQSLLLNLGVTPAQSTLKEKLINGAEKVIADFRNDVPSVRESDWRQQLSRLNNALELDPNDAEVKARMRYCEGQISRINGEAHKKDKPQESRQRFNDAINSFNEAARLKSQWADPYLGLARVCTYGIEDIENATKTLEQLVSLGYLFWSTRRRLIRSRKLKSASRTRPS